MAFLFRLALILLVLAACVLLGWLALKETFNRRNMLAWWLRYVRQYRDTYGKAAQHGGGLDL